MTAPVVVSAAASTYAAATAITVALPPTLAVGNYLVVFVDTREQNNIQTLSDGINSRNWRTWLNTLTDQCAIFTKPVDGTETGSIGISWSLSIPSTATAVQLSGTSLNPVDAVGQGATTGNNISTPSVNAIYPADLMLSMWSCSNAAGITLPGSQTTVLGNTTGNNRSVNTSYEVLSASGFTGTRTATCTGGVPNHGITILLREPNLVGRVLAPLNDSIPTNGGVVGSGSLQLPAEPSVHIGGATMGNNFNASVQGLNGGGRWGLYKVTGHALRAGTLEPLARDVMLLSEDGRFIVRGWRSLAADGSFEFTNLRAGDYIVMGFDQTREDNSPIYARVTAVPM